jgi:putative nucleotidyltransferase with HDIG domain
MNPNSSGSATPLTGNPSMWENLIAFLRRMLGGQPVTTTTSEKFEAAPQDNAMYVIAPGGYRIRVPQTGDMGDRVGELIPEVRAGLALLPPLPHVVTEILREIQDSNSTASSVANIAASDPALAASLLRMVNSAASGMARKTTSVADAVSYLGFAIVRSLVVKLRLGDVLPVKGDGIVDAEDLWVHSLAVSYIADALSDRVPGIDKGFVWTLGLLHDIGKLAIISRFPDQAAQLRFAASQHDGTESSLQREARLLGSDHAGAGSTLAWQWKLPADLVQAIRYHHNPMASWKPGDPAPLKHAMYIVQIANQLAKYCYTYSDDMEIDAVDDQVFRELGLPASMPQLLDHRVRAAVAKAIFFAEESTQRPLTSVRRLLRLHHGDAAMRLATRLQAAPNSPARLTIGESAATALFAGDCPVYQQRGANALPAQSVLASAKRARFAAPANSNGIKFLLEAMELHQSALELSVKQRQPAMLLIRALLPNLIQDTGEPSTIETVQFYNGRRLQLAFRAPCLSISKRLGQGADPELGRRVLEAELANILNLGWFEQIQITSDGGTILFVGDESRLI